MVTDSLLMSSILMGTDIIRGCKGICRSRFVCSTVLLKNAGVHNNFQKHFDKKRFFIIVGVFRVQYFKKVHRVNVGKKQASQNQYAGNHKVKRSWK